MAFRRRPSEIDSYWRLWLLKNIPSNLRFRFLWLYLISPNCCLNFLFFPSLLGLNCLTHILSWFLIFVQLNFFYLINIWRFLRGVFIIFIFISLKNIFGFFGAWSLIDKFSITMNERQDLVKAFLIWLLHKDCVITDSSWSKSSIFCAFKLNLFLHDLFFINLSVLL